MKSNTSNISQLFTQMQFGILKIRTSLVLITMKFASDTGSDENFNEIEDQIDFVI